MRSAESAHLRDVPQLQVYELTADGSKTLGPYRYTLAAGVTEQDKPVLIERIESALQGSVDPSSKGSADFQPDYAVSAGAMVIAIDKDLGVAEVAHEGEKRLVQADKAIADSLKTIVEGGTITGG